MNTEDSLAKLRKEWVEKPEKRSFILRQVKIVKGVAKMGGYKTPEVKTDERELEVAKALF
jgi:hypothetical protein